MRSDAIKPGDLIAGKYRVRAILSRTRGFLVEAFHTEFDQRVVIRVLPPQLVEDKEVERFRRETRTLAKLQSEHVARILDVGRTQDGAFFFARQYLEGQDLASYLKQRGALSVADAVLYVLQAAEAVAETHVHSIILRELQPAHLFLTQRLGGQQVKIIDFGTAKLMREAAAPSAAGEMTATSMFGLSCYSSPELVRRAQHVDVRTDVWSLGAILYQLLTGRPPFTGEMAALMLAITRDDPVPATHLRRDLPPDFDNIIAWALAKDPDGRFANVYGFAHALLPFATSEGQILVKRIGEITTAGKRRKAQAAGGSASAVDPHHPITIDGDDLLEEEDDDDGPRTAYRAPDAPTVSPGYRANVAPQEGSPLERTVFIPQDQPGASPLSPSAAARAAQSGGSASVRPPSGPVLAGAAAEPGRDGGAASKWQPMPVPLPPGGGSVGTFGPAAATGDPKTAAAGAQAQSAAHPHALPPSAMATLHTSSPSGGSSAPGAKTPPRAQKMALAAVAGAVVLLSVVAVLVVFKGRPASDATAEVGSSSASAAPTAVATVGAAPAATGAASAAPGDVVAPSAADATGAPSASAAPAPPPSTGPVKVAVAPVGTGAGKLPVKEVPVKVKPDPAPAAAPAPAGGGDNGTLVAVAVGGSCAFSVNGASKGTTSTLKLSLKPGTYSVTCAPSSGSSKSKSVTVTSGGTAMAMFKL